MQEGERGAKLRYIADITKDNFHYCKEISCIANEMRHIEGFSGGLAVGYSGYLGTTVLRKKNIRYS